MDKSTPCETCPLRMMSVFRPLESEELAFVAEMKRGELSIEKGATVLEQDSSSPHVFTVLSGIGYRQKAIVDGRRQILNFVMPGDLIGLQAALFEKMEHSVVSLTEMTLCVFERTSVFDLLNRQPSLAYNVIWHAAREEQMLDEHLVSVGRRTARERLAYVIAFLAARARKLGLVDETGALPLPLRQSDLADVLGLSLVHTNKTLQSLRGDGLFSWHGNRLQVRDESALRDIARADLSLQKVQPLI
jgi:CRP-like cAMP-binding protein